MIGESGKFVQPVGTVMEYGPKGTTIRPIDEVLDAEITIDANGTTTLTGTVPVSTTPYAQSTVDSKPEDKEGQGIAQIITLVNDPEAQLADISRLIALEIAAVISLMGHDDPLKRNNRSMRDLNDQVKALRELQKTLTESDQLSKRDVLNMDGPKFQFMFKAIIDLFKQALKAANVDESLSKNVMLNFGDLVRENDEKLRREVNKIEMGR